MLGQLETRAHRSAENLARRRCTFFLAVNLVRVKSIAREFGSHAFNRARNRGRFRRQVSRGVYGMYVGARIIIRIGISRCNPRAEILQNEAAIIETIQGHLGQNAVSRSALNCDEICVDQIADANNGENLLSR